MITPARGAGSLLSNQMTSQASYENSPQISCFQEMQREDTQREGKGIYGYIGENWSVKIS